MLGRIEYEALRKIISTPSLAKIPLEQAMTWLGHEGKLPKECPNQDENNEDILKAIHHALLEVEMVEGKLVCPESGREFPVKNGIPNMLLNEDEVWIAPESWTLYVKKNV